MPERPTFEEFHRRYLADRGLELAPWQRKLADRVLRGEEISFLPARPPRMKRLTLILVGAYCMLTGLRWTIYAHDQETAQAIMDEARELADRWRAMHDA